MPRSPCPTASSSTRPTSAPSAPRLQLAADSCPQASIYGKAKATPRCSTSPWKARSTCAPPRHKLPDLVADLNGQIDVVLAGKVDTGKGGGIRNTFEAVPDAPVSKFVLEMQGGKKGPAGQLRRHLPQAAEGEVNFTAQNGKALSLTPTIENSCGKAKKKGAKKGSHGKKGR